jgi:hypothetical protein
MIEKAKELSKGSQEILLAYLHFLHMTELLTHHDPQSNYRNYQYHWVRPALPSLPSPHSLWAGEVVVVPAFHWVR